MKTKKGVATHEIIWWAIALLIMFAILIWAFPAIKTAWVNIFDTTDSQLDEYIADEDAIKCNTADSERKCKKMNYCEWLNNACAEKPAQPATP